MLLRKYKAARQESWVRAKGEEDLTDILFENTLRDLS
jgi:hypothetical protein